MGSGINPIIAVWMQSLQRAREDVLAAQDIQTQQAKLEQAQQQIDIEKQRSANESKLREAQLGEAKLKIQESLANLVAKDLIKPPTKTEVTGADMLGGGIMAPQVEEVAQPFKFGPFEFQPEEFISPEERGRRQLKLLRDFEVPAATEIAMAKVPAQKEIIKAETEAKKELLGEEIKGKKELLEAEIPIKKELLDIQQRNRIELADKNNSARADLERYKQSQANNRAQLRAKGAATNSLSIRVAQNHDANPLTKRMVVASEARNTILNLPNNSNNPGDDIALIYAFAKTMDPDSVVREGEYNTVQKYAQSWKSRFGLDVKRIVVDGKILTPEARLNLKKAILEKIQGTQTEYNLYRKSIVERLNNATGENTGDTILGSYLETQNPQRIEKYKGKVYLFESKDGGISYDPVKELK